MPADFKSTLRSLGADTSRGTMKGLAVAAIVAGVWGFWFFGSKVSVYEVTTDARIEDDRSVYNIAAPIPGRIVSHNLLFGADVHAGDIVVEMDAQPQRLQLEEVNTHIESLRLQSEPLKKEIATLTQSLSELQASSEAELRQARADLQETQSAYVLANGEAGRLPRLSRDHTVASLAAKQTPSKAELRAALESGKSRVHHLEMKTKRQAILLQVQIEDIRHYLSEIEGQIRTAQAAIPRLENEVEIRRIRAPISGRIGNMAEVHVGSVIAQGDLLAAIVVPGNLRILAKYPPAAAVGRIKRGQSARLRLDGFPWIQYGIIQASVTAVGDESRDGRMRVELAYDTSRRFPVPLLHGMTGAVEVEVERISPARLILLTVGKRLSAPVTQDRPPASPVVEGQP